MLHNTNCSTLSLGTADYLRANERKRPGVVWCMFTVCSSALQTLKQIPCFCQIGPSATPRPTELSKHSMYYVSNNSWPSCSTRQGWHKTFCCYVVARVVVVVNNLESSSLSTSYWHFKLLSFFEEKRRLWDNQTNFVRGRHFSVWTSWPISTKYGMNLMVLIPSQFLTTSVP